MNNSRQQDHERLNMFIYGANIAHFLSLLGRETDPAKRATLFGLLREEREKEQASSCSTMASPLPASPLPSGELRPVEMATQI